MIAMAAPRAASPPEVKSSGSRYDCFTACWSTLFLTSAEPMPITRSTLWSTSISCGIMLERQAGKISLSQSDQITEQSPSLKYDMNWFIWLFYENLITNADTARLSLKVNSFVWHRYLLPIFKTDSIYKRYNTYFNSLRNSCRIEHNEMFPESWL